MRSSWIISLPAANREAPSAATPVGVCGHSGFRTWTSEGSGLATSARPKGLAPLVFASKCLMYEKLLRLPAFTVPLLPAHFRTKQLLSATMSRPPLRLDSLRSTRTRIAKPVSTPVASVANPDSEGPSRDFACYLGDQHPLRVIFIGHNPSDKSWTVAAPYAHKSNRFWRLVEESGLVPEELAKPEHFSKLPAAVGVGFADLFVTSGSDASKVNEGKGISLRKEVVGRVLKRTGGIPPKVICCVSKIVAKKLLAGWNGDYGRAGTGKEWGLDAVENTIVWVLPSTSGRAGLTWEQRLRPFEKLAEFVKGTPWTSQAGNASPGHQLDDPVL